MRRWLLALSCALLFAGTLEAQTAPKVFWEHDGANVTTFKCVVDSTTTDLGLLTPDSGTTYSTTITNCAGVLTNGSHTLKIQACNGTTCADSAAITVVKL